MTENVEHVMLHCRKYMEERIGFMEKIIKAWKKWNIESILGTVGEGIKDAQRATIEYLNNTGLYN